MLMKTESQCFCCKKFFPVAELQPLPETEKYYRELAKRTLHNEDIATLDASKVQNHILLCKQCLKKYQTNKNERDP